MKKSSVGKADRSFPALCANVGSFVRRSRNAAVHAFDGSGISALLKKLRSAAPYIQNRTVGVFLLTFGAYSVLISIFKYVFDFGGEAADVYVSACVVILSLPWLLSRGTPATMMTESASGRVFAEAVGIRVQTMCGKNIYGKSNVAFLLGMLFGTAVFVFSPARVICFVCALASLGIIFTYPEASVLFLAVILPVSDGRLFSFLAFSGTVSLIIKVLRGKRSFSFPHHRIAVLIFLAMVLCAEMLSGSYEYTVMLLVFFLLSVSDGLGARAEKTAAAAVMSCSGAASVYIGFIAISYFGGAEGSFGFLDDSGMALMCAALIPLAVSFMISGKVIPQRTALLCLASMTAFIAVSEKYMYLAAALFSIMVLLFFYRKRAAYSLFAVLCACYAGWVWLGGSNRMAVDVLLGFFKGLGLGENRDILSIITGGSLEGGFAGSESFYGALISKLGMTGLVLLISSVILLFGYILREKNDKYGAEGSPDYMRAWAPACSVAVLLICGVGINVWKYESVFVLFWMLIGASSAIASDMEKKSVRLVQCSEAEMSARSADITI